MIKNNQFYGLVGMLAVIVSITGCQKDRYDHVKPGDNHGKKGILATAVDYNNDNSLDYLGQEHNYSLDHLASTDCIDTTKAERYDKLKQHFDDSLEGDHFLSHQLTKDLHDKYLGDTVYDKTEFVTLSKTYFHNYLKDSTSVSRAVESYIGEMTELYENYSNYDTLIHDLESLEADVNQDNSLSSKATDLLLGALAIARNDVTYWHTVKNDSSHEWHDDFTAGMSSSEQTDLMLNLSLASAVNFSRIYDREKDNNYSDKNAFSAASLQAAYGIGPMVVDTDVI